MIPYTKSTTSSGIYDVIIVGGGHNGLTCAAFLARAGKRVLVLEASKEVGGLCSTFEMPNAPGFFLSPGAQEFILTGVPPSVIDQLDLAKYGLQWIYQPCSMAGLYPDGAVMPYYKDLNRTIEAIRKFSHRDAVRYKEMVDEITAALYAALPYLLGHPFRISPTTVFKTLKALLKGRKKVARGARIMLSSIETVLEEYFTREEIKASLGSYSMASWGPISEPGSGLFLLILTGQHEWGVRRPVGGSGQFPRALAACVVDHGGEVRVSAPVKEIQVRNGRAVGVTLQNGEEIKAKQVVGSTDPVTLATKLIDPKHLPDSTHEQLRGLQVSHHDFYIFKADVALSGRPKFSGLGHEHIEPQTLATLSLCSTLDDVRRSAYLAMNGEYADRICLYTTCASFHDRTIVPPGSSGDTFYLYAFNVPYKLRSGRTWKEESQIFFQKCMDTYEIYAPGTRDLIIDAVLTPPDEFEGRFNVYKGNYSHVDVTPSQSVPWRPFPDFAAWKTPIDGLWNASAGSFPMSYVCGWPGRGAAREVLTALKKYKG